MSLDPKTILSSLTQRQQEAASIIDGAVLVLAGPGSGKTRVITHRIAHLIANGIEPWRILALTFTNKAAQQMHERVEQLLEGVHHGRPRVCTFHSFCASIVRRWGERLDIDPGFSIYDTSDQRDAVRTALQKLDLDSGNWTPASVLSTISAAKNSLQSAEQFADAAGDFYTRSIAKIYTAYQETLRRNNALDFDDLLLRVAELLRSDKEVLESLRRDHGYILIDEYQDTNHAQFVIAHSIAAEHGNIFVVGDPDQSIYGWRGADLGNILEFEQQYPGTEVIPLGENFRSTGHIVSSADGLIRHNSRRRHKDLHTSLGDGEKVAMIRCNDEHHEAERVAELMVQASREGVPWNQMAVLYRVNSLSRVLEEAMRQHGIPYVIARGTAFYDRKEIKDALAYLRLVVNHQDDVALKRIVNTPARGIGATTMKKIEVHATSNQQCLSDSLVAAREVSGIAARTCNAIEGFTSMISRWRRFVDGEDAARLPDLVTMVISESGLESAVAGEDSEEARQRQANLNELITASGESQPPEETDDGLLLDALIGFLESVALVSDSDSIDPDQGAVTLMTLHAAKGLEFDLVCMVAMEEGLLPHSRSAEDQGEMEEERRLCFVGMTRARKHLSMLSAASRMFRGARASTIPSSFLGQIPEEHVQREDLSDQFEPDEPERLRVGTSSAQFPVGSLVRHPQFGTGTVQALMPRGSVCSARILFDNVGSKTLVLEYARLQRLR